MGIFSGLRAVVYLKRISESLERIAAFADAQMPSAPKRSKRNSNPETEVLRPGVKEWNQSWRERNPEDYERMRDEL